VTNSRTDQTTPPTGNHGLMAQRIPDRVTCSEGVRHLQRAAYLPQSGRNQRDRLIWAKRIG
jgi:hypothetical protein